MRHKAGLAALTCAVVFLSTSALAIDPWDAATEDDDSNGTDNGLTHGTEQVHDLQSIGGVADQDWYVMTSQGRSSYEIVIDGTTGDLDLAAADVTRLGPDGLTVVQNSATSTGFGRVLRWQNTDATGQANYIRVTGAACGTTCTSSAQYRIRAYETTYAIPRFNNTATQTTVLLVTNMMPFNCDASFHFYNAAGTHLGVQTNSFTSRALYVLSTSTLGFAAGQSGTIYVAHTCGYGGLAGKAVALEPATGFTFDTPMVPRIN